MSSSSSGLTSHAVKRLKDLLKELTRTKRKRNGHSNSTSTWSPLATQSSQLRDVFVLVKGGGVRGARVCWGLLKQVLTSSHALTRFRALIIVDALFSRSRAFREALCRDMRLFLTRVVQIPGVSSLPGPEDARVELHRKGIECIEAWNSRFRGKQHPGLKLAVSFLNSKLDNVGRRLRGGKEEEDRREREERSQRILRAEFEVVRDEIRGRRGGIFPEEMQGAVKGIEEASNLLEQGFLELASKSNVVNVHKVQDEEEDEEDDFDIVWSDDEMIKDMDPDLAEWEAYEEMGNAKMKAAAMEGVDENLKLNITIRKQVSRSEIGSKEEFEPIVNAIRGHCLECVRTYLPLISRWVRVLSRVELEESWNLRDQGDLLAKALDLKSIINQGLNKAATYGVKISAEEQNKGGSVDFLQMLETGKVADFVDGRSRCTKDIRNKLLSSTTDPTNLSKKGGMKKRKQVETVIRDPFAKKRKRK